MASRLCATAKGRRSTLDSLVPSVPVRFAIQLRRREWLEGTLVALLALVLTLRNDWRIITGQDVFQTDAMIHEFWMRRFQDPALFTDSLTESLVETGYIPPGHQGLLWSLSNFMDPVSAAELLPLVLVPVCAWLIFRIVREHTEWLWAGWIAVVLFLLPWDIHRFSGGHSRAFMHPVVLLMVYLLLRKKIVWAAVVPPVGVLLYPSAGAVAVAILGLSAIPLRRGSMIDRKRLTLAVVSGGLLLIAAFGPRLLHGEALGIFSIEEARQLPEFSADGQMHFFREDLLKYLKANYSGFHLKDTGSMLAMAALLLFALRPANAKLFRREIWMMPVAALLLWSIAQLVLFRLYLPHRYTYPLIPFFCIAIGVAWKPTLDAFSARLQRAGPGLRWIALPLLSVAIAAMSGFLALVVFPLGPQMSLQEFLDWVSSFQGTLLIALAAAVVLSIVLVMAFRLGGRRVSAAGVSVLLGAGLLVGALTAASGASNESGRHCVNASFFDYLQTTPKDTIIAGGDPKLLDCIPIGARRPVLISRKLYQPWDKSYFRMIRPRMLDMIEASYGSSVAQIDELRQKYGVDILIVDDSNYLRRSKNWRNMAPFTELVQTLKQDVGIDAAALRLPASCVTFEQGPLRAIDLACVARQGRPLSSRSIVNPSHREDDVAEPPQWELGVG